MGREVVSSAGFTEHLTANVNGPVFSFRHGDELFALFANEKLFTNRLPTTGSVLMPLEAVLTVEVATAVFTKDRVVALVCAVLTMAGFASCHAPVMFPNCVRFHAGEAEKCLVCPSLQKVRFKSHLRMQNIVLQTGIEVRTSKWLL
jgi:hypothetical protein